MYDAKRRGDGVLHYDSTQDLASPERLSLLADLQTALDADDQLSLHFQPQLGQGVGHDAGGALFLEAKLRVHVDLAPPGDHFFT